MKWLNRIGAEVLSLTHSAGGTERNWSTHGFIYSDLRQSQATTTLERNVRMHRNMRLRDSRGGARREGKEAGGAQDIPFGKGPLVLVR